MKKVHFIFLLFFCSVFSFSLKAQLNTGGTPPSFNVDNLTELSFITMPSIDIERLNSEDAFNDLDKSIPWRFGENLFTDLNPGNSGVWNVLDDGSKIWRLGIICKGASSINLAFNKYHLPKGAKLFVYNEDKSFIAGAFTDLNNQKDNMFATTLIPGESIIIEYYEPAVTEFKGELNLWRVTHGYRGPYSKDKGFGTSGACQRNVVCPEGIGWENQIKSECMLVTNGNGFCSGTLINNTLNDGTPYVITANHCYSDPATWVFWFDWKSPDCTPNTPKVRPNHNDCSGATLKAKNSPTDFCLVQLNTAPPDSFGVYYVGWSRSTTPATMGICIHHPDGDITKISPSIALRDTVAYNKISWKATWVNGPCTEAGSSGSPIYDQNHRFVGQLFGGLSACGLPLVNMWDVYGKFDVSWEGGGTPSTRLKDWLDPNNSNITELDGFDPLYVPSLKNNTNLNLNVFPNPNNGSFSIKVKSQRPQFISFSVINVFGVSVFEKNKIAVNSTYSEIIDLRSLPNGIYYMKVQSGNEILTEKIVIQK